MFDVGFAELFLLALIGLLVLGPERLPRVARTLGGLVRKARTSWFALRRSIESELAAADLTEPIKSAGKEFEEVAREIKDFGEKAIEPENTAVKESKEPKEPEPEDD
ncbi:MAG: twin-arginine translocase subunit TatB [Xanthomonadales bacterium]|nr:twin-arginine translocase subunit TatB [Xanthomonadales bacterium]NIX11980.1 twin-arginine translocase subunit TatB [Xanthomonadales bacterium]